MKRLLAIGLSCTLLGAGCFSSSQPSLPGAEGIAGIPFESIEAYVPDEPQPEAPPDDLPPAPVDPAPKTGELASASGNIIVSSLIPDQTLSNPFVILGRGRAFENVINWRVRDERYEELASGFVMTNAEDAGLFGQFRIRAFFDEVPNTERGFVEVFTISPRDGSEQDKVSIPVQFETSRTALKVFFSNIVEDPQALNCERVYPVTRRVVKTQNVAEAAVLELLKGVTAGERANGSRTSILPGTQLRTVNLEDGVLTVDFSRELVFALAGSCQVQALVAQIDETLKQFDSVEVVRIFVEGEDAELELQP